MKSFIVIVIGLITCVGTSAQTTVQYFTGTSSSLQYAAANGPASGLLSVSPSFSYIGQAQYGCPSAYFNIAGPLQYQGSAVMQVSGPGFSVTEDGPIIYRDCGDLLQVAFGDGSSFTVDCWPYGIFASTPVLPLSGPPSYCSSEILLKTPAYGFIDITLGRSGNSPFKLSGDPSVPPGSCSCAEPISVATGNLYESAVDYTTAGPNTLTLARYYNSQQDPSSFAKGFGYSWRTNFDRYLRLPSVGSLVAERANGQEVNFSSQNGVFATDSDVDVTLSNSGNTWTLTDHDDTVETYMAINSNEAILASITSRDGYTQSLTYNSSNQLTSVTDSYGRTLQLAYVNGLVQSVTTPDGTVLTYAYTSSGVTPGVLDRLASVIYSTTPQTSQTYLYENAALPLSLTGITDEDGNRYATWGYDVYGRAVSNYMGSSTTQANLTTIQYEDITGNRTVTNALGVSDLYQFTTLQGVTKVTEIDRQATQTTAAASSLFTYDANGYLASRTDWNGNLTTLVNDGHGQPTSIVEAVGTPQTRTTAITYLPNFHLPASITVPGLSTNLAYDASGNLQTLSQSSGTGVTQTRTWNFTWGNFGLLATAKSPRTDLNATTKYSYNGNGAVTEITNALGQNVQIPLTTAGERPETIIDANGVKTQLAYDNRQRLISKTVQTAAGALVTTLTYDAAGNLLSYRLPDGSTLTNSYDTAHRLTQTKDSLGNYIVYTLDGLGDRTQTSIFSKANALTWKSAGSFDALGRELVHTAGAGQTMTKSYDANGNILSVEDGLKHTTTNTYDPLNRLSTSTDPNLGLTTLSYDTNDRLVKLVDATSHSTAFTRDGFGDVIKEVGALSKQYTYDTSGDLINSSIPLAHLTTTFSYDALNRPVEEVHLGLSQPIEMNYTYDGAVGSYAFGIGRLTSLTDNAGSVSYQYDERGNRLSEKRTNGTTTLLTSYSYDSASRIASTTYPDGTIVNNQRDAAGNVSGVTAKLPGKSSATSIATFLREPLGPISGVVYENGGAENWKFDTSYRPTQITDAFSGVTMENLSYVYDLANNVSLLADSINTANTQAFSYDLDNRLTTAISDPGGYGRFAWTYDKVGNRLTQVQGTAKTTYTYASTTNWLTSIATSQGTVAVSTNTAGNITSITPANSTAPATFTYNATNRLGSVTGSPTAATFVYDYAGQRFSKTDGGVPRTVYSYGQDGAVIAENDGGTVTDYVYVDGRPLAVLQSSSTTTASQINYVIADRLGTPQTLVNSSGAKVWSTTYQPFGATGTVTASIIQNLRFPGQLADAETGFNYNMNRDYMPNLGRYLETDPIGLLGGVNAYAYVGQNPLSFYDSSGLQSSSPGPPPIPVPGGGPNTTWRTVPGTMSRPEKYVPSEPVGPSGSPQPSASWDPNTGKQVTGRCDQWGQPLTSDQAHGRASTPQPPQAPGQMPNTPPFYRLWNVLRENPLFIIEYPLFIINPQAVWCQVAGGDDCNQT